MNKAPELKVCASCFEMLGGAFFIVTGLPGRYCSETCATNAADSARGLLWGDDDSFEEY